MAALLPITVLGAWQSVLSYRDARLLLTDRLRAKAWAIAESERDPFIIAKHALSFAGQQPAVLNIAPQCNDVLRSALEGADGIVNFLRSDGQGRARCSVLPFTPGTDISQDKWWIESRGKPGVFVSTPQFGRFSQQPVLIIVSNLQTSDGTFDGTLSAGISLERLMLALQRHQAGQSGAMVVTNRTGTPVLQVPAGKFMSLSNVQQARTEPLETIASDGSTWTFVSAPLFGEELYAIYAEPSQSLMAMQISSSRDALLLQLLALMTTSMAIWFAAQRLILNWLARLQQMTTRFAQGDFAMKRDAYATAPAEIEQLAGQMHDMAVAILSHQMGLRDALAAETASTREVHHRVKNNLQIITSLLSLQSERASDPWARDVIRVTRTRIAALGLIHRLLYLEGTGAERGAVNIRQLFADLCTHLHAANRDQSDIALECAGADCMMSVDQAVPLTLFTVEAVTNAFRHAFGSEQTGKILVELATDLGNAILIVRDNGHGFRNSGATPGIGFDLMQAFATQLGGTVEIAGGVSGVVVTLRYSLAVPDS